MRLLKITAEQVREGDLSTRSSITTGDEFQELSETFNAMLAELQTNQDQLRAISDRVGAMDPAAPETQELMERGNRLLEEYREWRIRAQARQGQMHAEHLEYAFHEVVSAVNVMNVCGSPMSMIRPGCG